MENIINDMSMYFYIFAFICGAVTLVLNVITYQNNTSALYKKKLIFHVFFFIYIVFNFILFFGRVFSWKTSAHFSILMAYDISYICVLISFLRYLNQRASGSQDKKLNTAVGTICGIYASIWLITYIFSLDDRGYIIKSITKYITFSSEVILFLSSFICVLVALHKLYKRKSAPYWNIFIPGVSMLIYFVYTFIYNTDAIFRFIGPSMWFFYPLDGVLIIYLTVSITDIIYMRKSNTSDDILKHAKLSETVSKIGREYNLTNREQEIFIDMAYGKSNAEIANHYVISVYTVKRHINNINRKTKCRNRKENVELINRYLQ